jgi:hypothetical protein
MATKEEYESMAEEMLRMAGRSNCDDLCHNGSIEHADLTIREIVDAIFGVVNQQTTSKNLKRTELTFLRNIASCCHSFYQDDLL